jgi:hypothetical protein
MMKFALVTALIALLALSASVRYVCDCVWPGKPEFEFFFVCDAIHDFPPPSHSSNENSTISFSIDFLNRVQKKTVMSKPQLDLLGLLILDRGWPRSYRGS